MLKYGIYMTSADHFAGLNVLSAEDQDRVRESLARIQEGTWTVQMAPTSQAKCVACSATIHSDTLRIGRMKEQKDDGTVASVRWLHAKCLYSRLASHQPHDLFSLRTPLNPACTTLVGFNELPADAQEELRKVSVQFERYNFRTMLMPLAILVIAVLVWRAGYFGSV